MYHYNMLCQLWYLVCGHVDCRPGQSVARLCPTGSPHGAAANDAPAAAAAAAPAQPMDIELASRPDIPEMPAGWKPGDPLPHLPPVLPGVHICYGTRVVIMQSYASGSLHPILHQLACDLGWKPGDALPADDAAEAGTDGKPAAQAEPAPAQEQPKQGKELSKNDAFNFILNPDWESVEEDFSEEESE